MSSSASEVKSRGSFEKLQRFCSIRNESGYNSNLQFQIDLEEAGLRLEDLGKAYRVGEHGEGGYRWDTPWGTLYERPTSYGESLNRMEVEPITR